MIFKDKKTENPKAGLLLIASARFRNLGAGTKRGTCGERMEREAQSIAGSMPEAINVLFPGVVYEREDLRKAMNLFITEMVDFVIVEFLSWTEDFGWIRFLRDMPDLPILFVNPVRNRKSFSTTFHEDDFIESLSTGTIVGSLEAAGSITRVDKKNVRIVIGSRDKINREILLFSGVAKVRSVLRESIFGLLANFNELMWSTWFDPYNLFTRIGPELRFLSYQALADEIREVSNAETEAYKNELASAYKVMDDVDQEKFSASVRASIAMARLAERNHIDAMVFNDVDQAMFKLIGLRPGFYHTWFNKNLSVLVPEADIGGGLITFILKILTGKHVNFIEPFHIESEYNTFDGGHAGPNDHNDVNFTNNILIASDVRFAKTNYKYAGAPFAWYRISPGRKTMAQLSEYNGNYTLVCTLVDSLEGRHFKASYSHSVFKPLMPVDEMFGEILKIGTTQHFAIVDGDYCAELGLLSGLMGFEYHRIGQ